MLPLTDAERVQIIREVPTLSAKTLNDRQVELLLANPATRNPLYLLVALEELRGFGSYEQLNQRIAALPREGDTLTALFQQVIERLEQDFGQPLARRVLSLLGTARSGLSERELAELVADVPGCDDLFPLLRQLRPYLLKRAELLDFYHRNLYKAVRETYLSLDQAVRDCHCDLASYFKGKLNPVDGEPWSGDYPRALSELPYHQIQGEQWEVLELTLCDLRFIQVKCTVGMTIDLVRDYADALDALPERQAERDQKRQREESLRQYAHTLVKYAQEHEQGCPLPEPPDTAPALAGMRRAEEASKANSDSVDDDRRDVRIQRYASFVSSHSHILQSFPDSIIVQARNHASGGAIVQQAERLLSTQREPWIARDPRPPTPPITPTCIKALEGHASFVRALAITPDGKTALSAGGDGFFGGNITVNTVRVWDVHAGNCIRTLEGHKGRVAAVAVTPDGKKALSASDDNTVRVWDVQTGACIKTVEMGCRVKDIAITPNGKMAISATDGLNVEVWDVQTGNSIQTLKGHTEPVRAVAITPDGKIALSAGFDQRVRVWDMQRGNCIRSLEGHTRLISTVTIAPDGKIALSGSHDKIVCIWDLQTGTCIRTLKEHASSVKGVAITPDGKIAVSAGVDKTVRVWDVQTGTCIRALDGHTEKVSAVAITPDGKIVFSASDDKTVRVWDVQAGTCIRTLDGHRNSVRAVAMTPSGEKALSASHSKTVRVWDVQAGTCIRTLAGHKRIVNAVAITPDGKSALSASGDKTVRIWDVETGQCTRTLKGHTDGVTAVAITSDGKKALSASWDNTVRVWDIQTGTCTRVLEGHRNSVHAVAITPDGTSALSASHSIKIRVWDVQTGFCLRMLTGHTSWVYNLVMASDGKSALSASDDKTVRIWDFETGHCIRTLKGHTDGVTAVAIAPDGRNALSASSDKTVRVWDLKTGTTVAVYPLESAASSVAMITNNQFLAGATSGQLHFLTLHNWP